MYCPNCGSQNQDELKFCTRCGTNLAVVSEALTGKFEQETEIDERLVKLLKNYYRGRRNLLLGLLLTAIGGMKLSLLSLFNVPDTLGFVILIAAFASILIFGLVWFMIGATKWNNSSSELKALGYDNPKDAAPKIKKPVAQLPDASTVLSVKSYHTDSIPTPINMDDSGNAPTSITEHTTRNLEEERAQIPQPRQVAN